MIDEPGLRRGLTNYGDRDFALYLRRSFARSMGLSLEMLEKPIIGIAMTPSGFNNCHRMMPELVDAVSRGFCARTATQAPEGCDFAFLQHESTACWAGIEEN